MDFKPLIAQRKSKKVNQKELAHHLGISRDLVIRYEKKRSSPKLETFESWMEFIGMEITVKVKEETK